MDQFCAPRPVAVHTAQGLKRIHHHRNANELWLKGIDRNRMGEEKNGGLNAA
jgi:hypothetical protein